MIAVFRAPSKNDSMSIESGTSSSAPVAANSPIQVVPIWLTSGVSPPATEVRSLSWATSHAIGVTLTVTPGFCAMKSLARTSSFSPSAPIAQTVTVPPMLLVGGGPFAAALVVVAAAAAREPRARTAGREGS